jgi:broad specificity phosphatase PhoE
MEKKCNQETVIYLVRHGETEWNVQQRLQGRENTDLNANGRQQANALADFFKSQQCTKIVSSPLKRALDTALSIATQASLLPVEIEDLLIERDYGSVLVYCLLSG